MLEVAGWRPGSGLYCDEEADTEHGVPGLRRPGLQAAGGTVKAAPGEPRQRWSRATRPLVPDGSRLPCGPPIAAAVQVRPAGGLKPALREAGLIIGTVSIVDSLPSLDNT